MEVRWTRRALQQLRGYTRYVAQWSPRAADEMARRVRFSANSLGDNPLIGRQGRYLGTRELVIEKGRYILVYRVRGQAVQIITVHDARQLWPEDPADA